MPNMICTAAMCAEGRASVVEMRNTFEQLPNNLQPRFKPSVQAVQDTFSNTVSIFSEYIPFNPVCCAAKDIGAQADGLTTQMLAAMHAAGITTGPGSTDPAFDLNALLMLGALAVGLNLLGGLKALRS